MTPAAPATRKPQRTQIVGAVVLLLVIAVVLGVYYVGKASDVPGTSGAPTGTETTAAAGAATPVDQAKLATLMQKITANPKDTASLQGIGNLYFAAADYKNATLWEQKILAVDLTFDTILDAYDTFGRAAETKALKVTITR